MEKQKNTKPYNFVILSIWSRRSNCIMNFENDKAAIKHGEKNFKYVSLQIFDSSDCIIFQKQYFNGGQSKNK